MIKSLSISIAILFSIFILSMILIFLPYGLTIYIISAILLVLNSIALFLSLLVERIREKNNEDDNYKNY